MIKKIELNDLREISKYENDFNTEGNYKVDQIKAMIISTNYYNTAAFKDNNLIGYLFTTITMDGIDIIKIFISKSYRRQRVASSLLNALIDHYPKHKLFLEVYENNLAAINLYKLFNFKTVSVRLNYYGDKKNAVIMERGN